MAWLTDTVVLRHPDSGEPVALPAGTVLPEWAGDLVGGHVLTDDNPAGDQAAPDAATDGRDALIAELQARIAELEAAASEDGGDPAADEAPAETDPAPAKRRTR